MKPKRAYRKRPHFWSHPDIQPLPTVQILVQPQTLCLSAYGLTEPRSYIGMCGASSSYRKRVLCYRSWRPIGWPLLLPFIERFMNACRQTWPDWMPPQEPQWEMILS